MRHHRHEDKETDEEIDIRVIFRSLRNDLASIGKIKIANRMGNLIPLQSVARLERSRGVSFITRKDWRRTISVTADIDEKAKDVTSVYVNRLLQKKFAGMEERYQGYTVDYAGEFKDTQESFQNLNRSFLMAALAIYIILVALFKSLIHPVTIMGIIPLSFLAVVWVFFLHGLPLSFLAMMGIVGLAGVVVNNSIVYLDFINVARTGGMDAFDASIEAGPSASAPSCSARSRRSSGSFPPRTASAATIPFSSPWPSRWRGASRSAPSSPFSPLPCSITYSRTSGGSFQAGARPRRPRYRFSRSRATLRLRKPGPPGSGERRGRLPA